MSCPLVKCSWQVSCLLNPNHGFSVTTFLEVIEVLQKQLARPPVEPFPVSQQYVREIEKARGGEPEPEEHGDAEPKEPEPAAGDSCGDGTGQGSTWNYNEIKTNFMGKLREDGHSFASAKEMWNNSTEKKAYLGNVPLPILKKRRFVPKDATSNPWAVLGA